MSREPQDWLPRREWQRISSDDVELVEKWEDMYDNVNRIAAAYLLTKNWATWTYEQKEKYFEVMEGLDVDQIEYKWEEIYADDTGETDE